MFPEFFSILVAAGNDNLRQSLMHSLAPAGYRLEEVSDEGEALAVVGRRRFDLVLLGLCIPKSVGIEACRKLRARAPHLRIVMVREDHSLEDEELALDAGADDCISAPFRFREIVARLSAVLRRVPLRRGPKTPMLRAGCLEVDSGRRLLRRAGREVQLSQREFDILLFLMKNPEITFTPLKVLRAVTVKGNEISHGAESLRAQINALRRKIEDDPAAPEYLLTEPWVGYRFHNPGRRYCA
jgi:two-component system, OmpR family, KDP operon response regulator KdpE